MIETDGLYHLHLMVADMQRSMAFYSEAFGFQEAFRVPPDMVFMSLPGRHDLITLRHTTDPVGQRVGDNGGVRHFGFKLPAGADVGAAVAEIETAGGALIDQGEHAPGEPFAFVRDPDGYVIELS